MICAPRRWRPAARRCPLRPNRKLAALLLVCILLGGMAYFTVSVLHLITQLTVNSACDLMQLKINAASRRRRHRCRAAIIPTARMPTGPSRP